LSSLRDYHGSGVAALQFWGEDYLVSVGKDAKNTITLWNWKREKLCCLTGGSETPLLSLASHDGHVDSFFVSVGVNHIK